MRLARGAIRYYARRYGSASSAGDAARARPVYRREHNGVGQYVTAMIARLPSGEIKGLDQFALMG